MSKVIISDAVRYIGADDKDLDLFESQYAIPNGISYNSYVILDEKIAVMDTIDARKTEEWKTNLTEALAGRIPDYLVISHLEPDHAANIQMFAELYPEAKLVISVKGAAMLPQFFEIEKLPERTIAVKEGDSLLGRCFWKVWCAGTRASEKSGRAWCSDNLSAAWSCPYGGFESVSG